MKRFLRGFNIVVGCICIGVGALHAPGLALIFLGVFIIGMTMQEKP